MWWVTTANRYSGSAPSVVGHSIARSGQSPATSNPVAAEAISSASEAAIRQMLRSSNSAISPISRRGPSPGRPSWLSGNEVRRTLCRATVSTTACRRASTSRWRRSGAGSRARCRWALGSNWLMNHIRCANDSGSGPGARVGRRHRYQRRRMSGAAAMSSRTLGASNTSRRVTSTPSAKLRGRQPRGRQRVSAGIEERRGHRHPALVPTPRMSAKTSATACSSDRLERRTPLPR